MGIPGWRIVVRSMPTECAGAPIDAQYFRKRYEGILRQRRKRKHNSHQKTLPTKLETIPAIVLLLTSPRKPKKEAVVEILRRKTTLEPIIVAFYNSSYSMFMIKYQTLL